MPTETIVSYVAGLTAASKSDYNRFCEDNKLEPNDGRSKMPLQAVRKMGAGATEIFHKYGD
jgi:hypothetical protein